MNCPRSLQTSHLSGDPEWLDLDTLIPGDFAQWQTAMHGLGAHYVSLHILT
jgi:hypothetical protein